MKRVTAGLLFILLLILLFGSCSDTPVPEQAPVELEYWTVNKQYASLMQNRADAYNTNAATQVSLTVKVYSREQIVNKLHASFQNASGVPDMVDLHYMDVGEFIQPTKLRLYPLNSAAEPYSDHINTQALTPFMVQDILYALPYSTGHLAVYYNLDAFSSQGLDISRIATWEDFYRLGEALRDTAGAKLLAFDLKNPDLFLALTRQIESANNCTAWDAARQAQEYAHSFVDAGLADISPYYDVYNQAFLAAFANGEYGCVIAPLEYSSYLINNLPTGKGYIMAYPLPNMEDSGTDAAVPQYATAVTATNQHVALTKDFLVFARLEQDSLSETTNTLFVQNIGLGDVNHSLPDSVVYDDYFRGNPVRVMVPRVDGLSFPAGESAEQYSALFAQFVKALLDSG